MIHSTETKSKISESRKRYYSSLSVKEKEALQLRQKEGKRQAFADYKAYKLNKKEIEEHLKSLRTIITIDD